MVGHPEDFGRHPTGISYYIFEEMITLKSVQFPEILTASEWHSERSGSTWQELARSLQGALTPQFGEVVSVMEGMKRILMPLRQEEANGDQRYTRFNVNRNAVAGIQPEILQESQPSRSSSRRLSEFFDPYRRPLQVTRKDSERLCKTRKDRQMKRTLKRFSVLPVRKVACLGELFKRLKDCNFSNFQKLSNCPSTQRSRHALIEFNFFLNKCLFLPVSIRWKQLVCLPSSSYWLERAKEAFNWLDLKILKGARMCQLIDSDNGPSNACFSVC